MAFSPDDKTLAIADGDGKARLWDLTTHTQIGMTLGDPTVLAVAFSRDSKRLTTVAGDGTTRQWDLTAHDQIGGPLSSVTDGATRCDVQS